MISADEVRLLKRGKVADLLGVSVNTVDVLAERGVIPKPIDLGVDGKKNLRWRSTEIAEWMRTGKPGLDEQRDTDASEG